MALTNVSDSVTSSGVVTGDDPIHHALLLLIVQIIIIICLSRFITFLLRPLKQPRVVAEILGGILLGPTAFGYIPGFTENIFPQSSMIVLDTIADVGLIFFLFLVGLELDIHKLRKTGTMAIWMAASGIILPFGLGVVVSCIIYKVFIIQPYPNFGAFSLFIGVALSITAFPVLARILAERKLLTTEIGQVAMSAAALNDVVAWILLALAVAITNSRSSPLVALWVLLLGVAFLLFMFLVVSPVAYALAHFKEPIPEPVVAITLVLVLGAAFLTDILGIHVIFGAFLCGLIIPKYGTFAGILIEKVEDFVSVLFLPLYFAASGLKTHLTAINSNNAVMILALVLATTCLGKVLGTALVAKLWGIERRKAIALGFLMNTKGLVELIVLNIGLSKGVINEELFAILVVMAIVTTFITTPVVMWLYKPARDILPYLRRRVDAGDNKDELRILICAYGSRHLAATLNLLEVTKGRECKSLRAFVLHLMEYSDRVSSIRMASFSSQESRSHWQEGNTELNAVEVAFQKYAQLSNVKLKTAIAISAFQNMHIDICNTAAANRANLLILPFHMRHRLDGSYDTVHSRLNHVNLKVLEDPPCSLGLLIDKGFGGTTATPPANFSQDICLLFFGGPDDREALMLARRMSQHRGVKLTVIHFIIQGLGQQDVYPNIHRIPSNTPLSHLQSKSAAKHPCDASKQLCHKVVEFFKAPWCDYEKVAIVKHLNKTTNANEAVYRQTKGADTEQRRKSSHETTEAVQIKMDTVESQNENRLDMEALASLRLGLASVKKQTVSNLPGNSKEAIKSMEVSEPASSDLKPNFPAQDFHLQVCDTKDPQKSVLDIASSSQYGLIIVGLHTHPHSPVAQSGVFPATVGHGLGPLGNLLVSKQLKNVQASVLVIQQYGVSQALLEPSSTTILHPVAEEMEITSAISSGVSRLSQESEMDASITDIECYRSGDGDARVAAREHVWSALQDLGESLSSP